MTDVWPDEAHFGDVFADALRPQLAPFVLHVPAEVEDAGNVAVEAWLREHHPGYPVAVVPEKRTPDGWRRLVAETLKLTPEERTRRQQEWLAARDTRTGEYPADR